MGKSSGKQAFTIFPFEIILPTCVIFQFSAFIEHFLYVSSHCRGSKGAGIKEMTPKLSMKGTFQAERKPYSRCGVKEYSRAQKTV